MDSRHFNTVSGPASGASAYSTPPSFDMAIQAETWLSWPEDYRNEILKQLSYSRPAEGRRLQYLLNTLQSDTIVVACLKEIASDARFSIDARVFHGKPMLAICAPNMAPGWTLAMPSLSPVTSPVSGMVQATGYSALGEPSQQVPAHQQAGISQEAFNPVGQPLTQHASPSPVIGTKRRRVNAKRAKTTAREPSVAAGGSDPFESDAEQADVEESGPTDQGPPEG
ncbi:hypothetical protein F5Y04DRAFT_292551 [Hypomontagnella monticulosa]|nr:hypothetical protein F5Y04DRAFT_292551 [Hypomontagnella monticulosa]